MTAKIFHERLEDLMRQSFSENPVPLSQMILDFEMAKTKCVMSLLQVQAQNEIVIQTKGIIPANGMAVKNK